MKISIHLETADVANALRRTAARLDGNLRLALEASLDDVTARARKTTAFRDRSGVGRKSIMRGPITGSFSAGSLQGTVDLGEKYMTWLEFGTKAHMVRPKNKKALRFPMSGGFGFSKGHRVSGIKARRFMLDALRDGQPTTMRLMSDAVALAFAQEGFR